MAGIKRKSPVEGSGEAKTKKVKKTSTDLAVREVKPEKKSKKSKEEKSEKKDKKDKKGKKKSRAPEPEPEEADEDMVESDTSEAENGFYGFSASGDGAALPDGDEDEDMDDDEGGVALEDKPSKKNGYQSNNNEKSREKKGDAVNPQTSREAHAKQKEVARERKAAKPNADSIQRAKKLWERLRIKSAVEPEERKRLVAELFDIITGRVKDFVFKHDSVRPVQCALKYASPQQRLAIAKELKGDFKSLAESKYAKFLIAKILVEGDDEVKSLVITDFYGNVRRLINHPEAAWILDDAYRGAATPSQKSMLLREWYGPDFALFRSKTQNTDSSSASPLSTTANLKQILEASPEKRKPVMDYLHQLINQLIQKKLTGFTMLHDAMLQYYLNLSPSSSEFTEFFELLKSDEEPDLLKNLAFTKSGSVIISHLLAYSDAKSRRQILKAYKDTIEALTFDKHGHQVLLTAFEVIDDTKMTAKAIFPELFGDGTNTTDANEKVLTMSTHLTARIPLLALLSPTVASKIYTPEYSTFLSDIHSIRSTTSKKDPTVRRKELIGYLAPYVTTAIQHRAFDFSTNTFGCQFVAEALLSTPAPPAETLSAVADLAKGDPTTAEHVAQSAATGRMLTSLVRGGRFNAKTKQVDLVDPPLGFANLLYERISEHLVEWATGPSSFVIVAMVENSEFSSTDAVLEMLQKNKKKLEKAATTETAEQKAFKEQKAQVVNGDENAPKGNKKKKVKMGEVKVGNAGSRTLLEKLS